MIAVRYLEEKGYQILERNFRCRYAEIDIIAKKEEMIIFFEVKYRKNALAGSSLEAVDYRKQKRISKAALYFLARQGTLEVPCRFDVIGIDGTEIVHVEHAFEYTGA